MKCCLHIYTAHTHSLNRQGGHAQSNYVLYGLNADVEFRYVTKHADKTWLLWLVRQVTDSSLLRNVQFDFDAHTGSYLMGTGDILCQQNDRGKTLATNPHLIITLRMSGCTHLLPLNALTTRTGTLLFYLWLFYTYAYIRGSMYVQDVP
jgi:hypothetical protein